MAESFKQLLMVSIIILAYNRCAEVLKTIDKLKQATPGFAFPVEIIVVDNASSDATTTSVKAQHPDITLITRTVNNGIAGWNDGFAIARYKYFLVLDDDSHIHCGLNEAVQLLERDPSIGILALQDKDEELKMDVFLDMDDAWKDGEELAGFIGCGAVIRQEVYQKIGGFAEWIFVYTHEFEYGIRCLNAGYKIKMFSDGIVIHRVSNLNRSKKRLRIFGTRNELAIVHKYFSHNKAKYLTRILVNNLKFIKREGLKTGVYVLQGFAEYLKFRKTLAPTPVSNEVQEFYANHFWATKSVFINFKKRFNKQSSR